MTNKIPEWLSYRFMLFTEAVLGVTLEQKEFSMTKEVDKTVHISCKVSVHDANHPESKDFSVRLQHDD